LKKKQLFSAIYREQRPVFRFYFIRRAKKMQPEMSALWYNNRKAICGIRFAMTAFCACGGAILLCRQGFSVSLFKAKSLRLPRGDIR